MARIILHRKENGQMLKVATGVVYVMRNGAWRETTKAEMDVLDIQITQVDNRVAHEDLDIGVDLPSRRSGEEGSYYVLLYPLAANGEFWDGEVWSADG